MQQKEKIVMRNLRLATLSLLLLNGCANQLVWNKPGATQGDFARDKYTRVQQARSPTSSSYLSGGYHVGSAYVPLSGGSSSGEIVNGNFFRPCMEAQGYTLTAAQATTPAAQEVKTKIQALSSQRQACINATRSKPQYAALASHLSVVATGAFSIAQLTDKSLATSAESQAVVSYYDEVNSTCNYQYVASVKAFLPAAGPIFAQAITAYDGVAVLLVERKPTWGEYAQRIKQRQDETSSQLNQIHI
jgi:hypothetical protein